MSRHSSEESTNPYLQTPEDLIDLRENDSPKGNEDLNHNEDNPKVTDLYYQDGVFLESGPASHIEYMKTPGTLLITKYETGDSSSLYVEWKPLQSFTIESDQDQEWALVNTIERRTRTLSGTLLPEEANRSKYLKIKLSDVKSYKLGNNHRKITFHDGSGESLCSFSFQNGNSDCFNNVLRQYIKTAPAKRDKNHFVIIGEISEADKQFKKSFGELALFPDEQPHYMWYLMKNFQQDPYEITKAAFARVADIVLASHAEREMEDDVKALLNKSITTLEPTTTTTQGEYEFVANVPKLPDRKDFPRSRPLTKEQWVALQDCHGRIEDVETTKLTIFRGGITPELRIKVWKYLLNYFDWDSTQEDRKEVYKLKEIEYFKMKKQWMSMSKVQEDNFSDYRERKSIIEKDVNRTDRHMDFFAGDDNPHLQQLHDILMTYVMYNFDLGYVQGMSDLLSPILYLMQSEIDAFWCFVGFMEKVNSNFDIDQAGMKEQLQHLHTLLQFIDPELSNYLDTHESGNMFFCFRWLLVWFKRELDMEDIMRLWEVLWTGLPCKNFHLLISVAILLNEKTILIEKDYGFTEILKHVNELSLKLDVNKLINEAEGIYYQIKEAAHATDAIKDIIGLPRAENNQVDSPNTNSFTYLDDSDRTESVYEKSISNNFY